MIFPKSPGYLHQKSDEVVYIDKWLGDGDQEHVIYPEGARSKVVVICPDPAPYPFLKAGHKYMFKRSSNRYPHQFWMEIAAYRLAALLGLEVPPAFAAFNFSSGESGALIEWFYRGGTKYISGGDLFKRFIPAFDEKRGTQHNIVDLLNICRNIRVAWMATVKIHPMKPAVSETPNLHHYWAQCFTFDALIGNTDRHQDNWGMLFNYFNEEEQVVMRMSPFFDNGTSMAHEINEIDFNKFPESRLKDHYIRKGTHHLRYDRVGNIQISHLDMMGLIKTNFPKGLGAARACLAFAPEEIWSILSELSKIEHPTPLSAARAEFTAQLCCLRQALLGTKLQ